MTPQQIIAEIRGWLIWAIDLGLLVLMFVMLTQAFGFRVPSIPAAQPQAMIFLFGCWAAYRFTR